MGSKGKDYLKGNIQTLSDDDLQEYLKKESLTTDEDLQKRVLVDNKFTNSLIMNHMVLNGKIFTITDNSIIVSDVSSFEKVSELKFPDIDTKLYLKNIMAR